MRKVMRKILPHNIIRYNYYKNLHHMPTNVVGNWFTWQTHLPGYLAKKLSTQKVYLPLSPLLKRKKKQLTKKFFTLVLENHFTTQRKNFLY